MLGPAADNALEILLLSYSGVTVPARNNNSFTERHQRFESHLLQQRVSRTPHRPIGPGETSKASRVAILPRQAGLRYVVEVKARANLPACRADPDRSVPADDRSADDGLGQAPRERPTLCSGHDQHDPSRLDEHRRTPRSSAFVPARSSSPRHLSPDDQRVVFEWGIAEQPRDRRILRPSDRYDRAGSVT